MCLLKYLPDRVHDILAHCVIFSQLTADMGAGGMLQQRHLVFVKNSEGDVEVPIGGNLLMVVLIPLSKDPG
jgi:hypothetical protein